MSRSRKLRLEIGILLAVVLAALFVIRVVYINMVKYQITERVVYQLQEPFPFIIYRLHHRNMAFIPVRNCPLCTMMR